MRNRFTSAQYVEFALSLLQIGVDPPGREDMGCVTLTRPGGNCLMVFFDKEHFLEYMSQQDEASPSPKA